MATNDDHPVKAKNSGQIRSVLLVTVLSLGVFLLDVRSLQSSYRDALLTDDYLWTHVNASMTQEIPSEHGYKEGLKDVVVENIESDTKVENETFQFPQSIKEMRTVSHKGTKIVEFERQEGVVIATKLHGHQYMPLLDQALCLLHHAYNHRLLYDIVVFYTEPIDEKLMAITQSLVAPAKITFVMDNRGFQEEVAALSPIRRQNFLAACNVSSPETLNWWSECPHRVNYNWQAEFRSWHIWKHDALKAYKWMMWIDTDGFSTRPWQQDPIATMIENDLVILFDNFPLGACRVEECQRRVFQVFNQTLCRVSKKDGHLQTQLGGPECSKKIIPTIHGFFHITNLDFFRSDIVQTFLEQWIGDGFLQRQFDDQAAVTIPPAVLAPERAWDMKSHGIELDIYHNSRMDGRGKSVGGFLKFWRNNVTHQFPEAASCPIKIGGRR